MAALAGSVVAVIRQDDTFLACATGRLKLRDYCNGQGKLIAYERVDDTGPRLSSYTRLTTEDPIGLRDALARSLGITGRVRKSRTLYLSGRTRIHLDFVEDLGNHMELEVVLTEDEAPDAGHSEAKQLIRQLGVSRDQLCAGAYVDLLAGRGN